MKTWMVILHICTNEMYSNKKTHLEAENRLTQRNLTIERQRCSEQLTAECIEIYDNNRFRGQHMK